MYGARFFIVAFHFSLKSCTKRRKEYQQRSLLLVPSIKIPVFFAQQEKGTAYRIIILLSLNISKKNFNVVSGSWDFLDLARAVKPL